MNSGSRIHLCTKRADEDVVRTCATMAPDGTFTLGTMPIADIVRGVTMCALMRVIEQSVNRKLGR